MTQEEIQAVLERVAPIPQGNVPEDNFAGRFGKFIFGPQLVQTPRDRLIQSVNTRNLIEDYLQRSERNKAATPALTEEARFRGERAKADTSLLPFATTRQQYRDAGDISEIQNRFPRGARPSPSGMVSPVKGINIPSVGDHPGENAPGEQQREFYNRVMPKGYGMDADIIAGAGGEPVMPKSELSQKISAAEEARGKPYTAEERQRIVDNFVGGHSTKNLPEAIVFADEAMKRGYAKDFKEALRLYRESEFRDYNRTGENEPVRLDPLDAIDMKALQEKDTKLEEMEGSPQYEPATVQKRRAEVQRQMEAIRSKYRKSAPAPEPQPAPQFDLKARDVSGSTLSPEQIAESQRMFGGGALTPSTPQAGKPVAPVGTRAKLKDGTIVIKTEQGWVKEQ